ncbi:hypothetical protein LOK49_Contig321G00003 [Camellia lanceoleosa]|nr:hypothetical protein LOK49_Contig321G00003 [Camellia lanceoleosa]
MKVRGLGGVWVGEERKALIVGNSREARAMIAGRVEGGSEDESKGGGDGETDEKGKEPALLLKGETSRRRRRRRMLRHLQLLLMMMVVVVVVVGLENEKCVVRGIRILGFEGWTKVSSGDDV